MIASPLRIRVEHLHPRVVYTCKTIFQDFLGLPCEFISTDLGFDLDYRRNPDCNKPFLPCDGLLYNSGFGEAAPTESAETPDILSRFFRQLSQFDAYSNPSLDAHQRHIERAPGLELHNELAQLRIWLRAHFPAIPLPEPSFSWEVTIDIDQPWKHKHKPLHVRLGGLARDILRLRFTAVRERLQARDPFDTLPEVLQHCPAGKTTAFILADSAHPNDSRFNLRQAPFQEYVRRWKNAGIRIGIHPSYLSSEQPERIPQEKSLLEACIGKVEYSRQHYLRYRLPSTFRASEAAGITHDYSLCPHEGLGGRTGIAMPYNWYDLEQERESNLRLVPAVVMDRSLQQYLALSPAAAFGQTCAVIDTLRAQGGHFVLILHNETFSESGEWKGWTRWIHSTMTYLQQHGS